MIKQDAKFTHGALTAPAYPANIPAGCKWLGGEGYGVWFLITKPEYLTEKEFRIRRYTDSGKLDCDRIFELNSNTQFFINEDFEFAYISHCQKCTIVQNQKFFVFNYKNNDN